MHSQDSVVIVEAKRTAIGSFQGALKNFQAPQLGALAIQACLQENPSFVSEINEVLMGCVLSAGLGQAPARQVAIKAGLLPHTPATTINKVCGSGMRTIMLAHDIIKAGSAMCIVAGGMESMSNAPYLLPKARAGLRMGHGQLLDHMFFDGLEDAYTLGTLMGCYAEETAKKYNFTRQAQDEFALLSYHKAKKAQEEGLLKRELIAIEDKKTGQVLHYDEPVVNVKPEKIQTLKPAFSPDGTVTAANASSIADGAAAVVLASSNLAHQSGWKARARIVAHTQHAHEPQWFTTAPVQAIRAVVKKAGWRLSDVDLWEINEAFAVVAMAAIQELDLDPHTVNIHGGACALGHPIGATGARLITSLLHALEITGQTKGVAAACIGGGEATAIAIERL